MSIVWQGRFETAKTVCFWLMVCFFGFWFCVGFFGNGRDHNHNEPFNPRKMSQVPKVWPAPAWRVQQPSLLLFQQQPASSAQPVRQRVNVPFTFPSWSDGFEFHDEWRAKQPCPNRPQ